jgi:DNA topoisomerase-2
MYVEEFVSCSNEHWRIAVSRSDSGFQHVSFVNGTETLIGGNHINYVADQIVGKLREFFNKKHKVDVKPSDIRNHLQLFIDATIIRPRYSSQTKEDLITEVKNFGTSFEIPDKTISKILKSSVIQSILDWVQAKEAANKAAELRRLNKDLDKTNLRKITKFTDASNKTNRAECMLMLCEGDSAANSVLSARTEMIGCYALKGKPINALGATTKDIMANKEFVDMMSVLGLKIGQPVESVDSLRFGRIVILADQDFDGSHVAGLLCAMFKAHWPELFALGMVYRFNTPLVKATVGKTEHFFYSKSEFDAWAAKNKSTKYSTRYLKGLGSSTANDFRNYFKDVDKHLFQIAVDSDEDLAVVDLVFGKTAGAADRRKAWLELDADAITP